MWRDSINSASSSRSRRLLSDNFSILFSISIRKQKTKKIKKIKKKKIRELQLLLGLLFQFSLIIRSHRFLDSNWRRQRRVRVKIGFCDRWDNVQPQAQIKRPTSNASIVKKLIELAWFSRLMLLLLHSFRWSGGLFFENWQCIFSGVPSNWWIKMGHSQHVHLIIEAKTFGTSWWKRPCACVLSSSRNSGGFGHRHCTSSIYSGKQRPILSAPQYRPQKKKKKGI